MTPDDQIKKLQKENKLLSHKLERIERNRMLLEARWDRNSNLFQKLHDEIERANRAKSDFWANISHEFRTPITLTLGPLEQILKDRYGKLTDDLKTQLFTVQRNQERLLFLINQILDVSKLESGRMRLKAALIADMNGVINEWICQFKPIAEKRNIELRESLDPQVIGADLFVDREMFNKLISNLLSNAFKFTQKGYIEVSTRIHEEAFHLTVSDTGMGIKQDELPHIFDRFRQANGSESREHVGTGLGLALVKEFTELHGGDVTVRSEYGKGSSFQVSFPLGKTHIDPASIVEFTESDSVSLADSQKVMSSIEDIENRESVHYSNREAEKKFNQSRASILYVEDNHDLRNHVRDILSTHYNVFLAIDGRDGLEKARQYKPDLILTDQMMPFMSGQDLLREIRNDAVLHLIPVVFLTARAGHESLIESLDAGADDYLSKPFDEGELLVRIRNILRARAQERELEVLNRELRIKTKDLEDKNDELRIADLALRKANEKLEQRVAERTADLKEALEEVKKLKNRLQEENIYLQQEIKRVHNFEEIISQCDKFNQVLGKVEQVAATDATVLILGESGTGKELVARAIHNVSNRKDRPLVKVNSAALPANLIESELFGHEKGAFTGALSRKIGRFELADKGTLFLDEIGDLQPELQSKLLRVLQDGEFERLGSSNTIKVNVRIIAATNRDLKKAIEEGRFREDLFYRLNVFPIHCPPLRERKEDIPLLAEHFVCKYCTIIGKKIDGIPHKVMKALLAYNWPGNIRELENIIERAVIITQGQKLELGDWLPQTTLSNGASLLTLEEKEREHILEILEMTAWRVRGNGGAAELLGLKPTTLEARMKKLKIDRRG
jgi:DNA-binding NtrC family response regulator/signal transduction histidine kinase